MHNLLSNFKNITHERKIWLIFTISLFLILSSALYFQYVKNMEPCYLCIIQRIGVIIALMGGLTALIKPSIRTLRYLAYTISSSGLILSLYASIKLVYMQLNPPLFSTCSMAATDLMETYGILKSIPTLFEGSASCIASSGGFLFLTFEQWTLAIFLLLNIIFFITLILNKIHKFKKEK